MSNHYFQQKDSNPFMSSMERPVKELMELQVKTAQGFHYFTPVELLKARKPEEVIEKNVELFIDNSHKALDYMHSMFHIMEKHWLSMSDNMSKNSNDVLNQTQKAARSTMSAAMDGKMSTSSNAHSHLKENMTPSKSKKRKSVETTAVSKMATTRSSTAKKPVGSTRAKKMPSAMKENVRQMGKTEDKSQAGKHSSSSHSAMKPAHKENSAHVTHVGKDHR
jgi:hypothetical protein